MSQEEFEPEDEAEIKKDEPITVVAKMTEYYSDGSVGYQHEYEYDGEGNQSLIDTHLIA